MGEPSSDTLHDVYEEQLSAARYKAERDAAVQELQAMRERNIELWMECGMANELVTCVEQKAKRLGKLVWRLQNRLARSHRREKALRKGMREWREKAIGGPVRTVSAYDLLPEDDLRTLRWVREHGGLLEVEKRIMPDGMEWPRYEDGEPVNQGSWLQDNDGEAFEAVSFVFTCDWWGIRGYRPDRYGTIGTKYRRQLDGMAYGTPVKRPAVRAADDLPLEVGQTAWEVDVTGHPFKVVSIRPATGCAMEPTVVTCDVGDGTSEHFLPSQLTHERPDSWERWRKEWKWPPVKYCKLILGVEYDHDTQLQEAFGAQGDDLVRRAKALAERGE